MPFRGCPAWPRATVVETTARATARGGCGSRPASGLLRTGRGPLPFERRLALPCAELPIMSMTSTISPKSTRWLLVSRPIVGSSLDGGPALLRELIPALPPEPFDYFGDNRRP